MFSQYFGQYLLDKGILSATQLQAVLAEEASVRVKLGILAIDAGYMTPAEVERVHELQKRYDKRFGELAIERGLLREAEVARLLEVQSQRYLQLSQAIVDQGYLSLQQVDEALSSYKEDNRLSAENLDALIKGDIDEIVRFSLDFGEVENATCYQNYTALLLRNMVRFLGETPVIIKRQSAEDKPYSWLITQQIEGAGGLHTGLGINDDVLLALAERYSGDDMPAVVDAYAKDCAAEFLNLTNGIFCVNASNNSMELDLELQHVEQQVAFPEKAAEEIVLRLSFGDISLLLA